MDRRVLRRLGERRYRCGGASGQREQGGDCGTGLHDGSPGQVLPVKFLLGLDRGWVHVLARWRTRSSESDTAYGQRGQQEADRVFHARPHTWLQDRFGPAMYRLSHPIGAGRCVNWGETEVC